MRQALLIFRKDVHHLWPHTLPLLLFSGFLGWLESRYLGVGPLFDLIRALWLLSALFLMASVVHQEHLPGHQQYWLTRPYSRRNLLLAKVLFLATFVVLPELAIEAVSLAVNGLSPLRYLPRLASTALIYAGASGIIFSALASVTENLVQLLWAFLPAFGLPILSAILIASSADPLSFDWGNVEWVRVTAVGLAVLTAAIAVLFLQYRHRQTTLSRCVLGSAILLVAAGPFLGSWHTARRVQSALLEHAPDSAVARFAFDTSSGRILAQPDPASRSAHKVVQINLPILVTGIPVDAQVIVERTSVRIETPGGKIWSSGWPQHTHAYSTTNKISHGMPANGPYWQFLNVDDDLYQAVKDVPVRLHTSTALMLVSNPKTIDLAPNGHTGPLADGAFCYVFPAPFEHLMVGCATPGGSPPLSYARVRSLPSGQTFVSLLSLGSGSPYSLDGSVWNGDGTLVSQPRGKMEVQLEIWQSAVHFDRDLDIPQIRLADYRTPRITDLR